MTGAELIRRLRKLARKQGAPFDFAEERGKGSHATIYFNGRRTTVKDRKKTLPRPLLRSMLRDLGLDESDLG